MSMEEKKAAAWQQILGACLFVAVAGLIFGLAVGYGLSIWDYRVSLVLNVPLEAEVDQSEERVFY